MFDQTLFARLATPCCVRQTRCSMKMFDCLAGALHFKSLVAPSPLHPPPPPPLQKCSAIPENGLPKFNADTLRLCLYLDWSSCFLV